MMSTTKRSEDEVAKLYSIKQARQNFSELLCRAHYRGERIIIARRTTPIAAIVSAEDAQHIECLLDGFGCGSLRELARKLGIAK